MALPDAADVARMRRIIARLRSYGVEVREMPGWETRGFRFAKVPTRIFDHHDASSRKSGEWGSLGLILDGTPRGIPGPLSNFQVARCLDNVPKVAVVAAGFTYHAGTGGPYYELPKDNANPNTYGTEKANDGIGEPYSSAANYATNATFHAAAVESGAIPESFPVGHKEWTTRKADPTYSMADRRRQVAAFSPAAVPTSQEPELRIVVAPDRTCWIITKDEVRWTSSLPEVTALCKAWGIPITPMVNEEIQLCIDAASGYRARRDAATAAAVSRVLPTPTLTDAQVSAMVDQIAAKVAPKLGEATALTEDDIQRLLDASEIDTAALAVNLLADRLAA